MNSMGKSNASLKNRKKKGGAGKIPSKPPHETPNSLLGLGLGLACARAFYLQFYLFNWGF